MLLKTKKMCKHAVKKLLFVIRHDPDRYQIQLMCEKDVIESGRTLWSVSDSFRNQQMCDKALDY